ncbi:MAG: nitronate monooxygenase, partial [bacterium]|nr:nitronate monooxygenase [bacterium]
MLRTEFCERVGIEYPVILAGMGPVAGTGDPVAAAELAAAVSNAGGLGMIGGVSYPPDRLREEIRKVKSLTDKPFGVDLLLASTFLQPRGSGSLTKMPGREILPKESIEGMKQLA